MDRTGSRAAGKSAEHVRRGARLIAGKDDVAEAGKTRSIELTGVSVAYRLTRARRRTIGMIINNAGLSVRAPRWVSIAEIEVALSERARWILKTLDAWRGRRVDALPDTWRQGAELLFQGRPLQLALFCARRKTIAADLLHLTVLHPTPGDEKAIAAYVATWLREQALLLLVPRAAHFASRMNAPAPPVRLSNARTQWGSCNHRGEIRLHWRLVQLPPRIADYVIAHEVAHLAELNHSPRFWALVERLFPGHAAARKELDDLTPLLS